MNEDKILQSVAITLIVYLHLSCIFLIVFPWYFLSSSSPRFPYELSESTFRGPSDLSPWEWLSFLFLMLFLNGIMVLVYWMYYLSSTVGPGAVPQNYVPDAVSRNAVVPSSEDSLSRKNLLNSSSLVVQRKRSSNKLYRYCKKCRLYKPPRSHHCSACGTCVLRMDHHCPWIGSCVGFFNHGHFFRFILWTCAASYSFMTVCIYKFAVMLEVYELIPLSDENGRWQLFQVMINLFNIVLLAIIGVALTVMAVQHFLGFIKNMTLIERLEMDEVASRIEYLKKRRDPLAVSLMSRKIYPYDLGPWRNLAAFMGSTYFFRWILPYPMEGDGLTFEVSDWVVESASKATSDGKQFFVEWPPKLDPEYENLDSTDSVYEQDEDGYVIPNVQYPLQTLPSSRSTGLASTHTFPHRDNKSVDSYLRRTAQLQRSKSNYVRNTSSTSLSSSNFNTSTSKK